MSDATTEIPIARLRIALEATWRIEALTKAILGSSGAPGENDAYEREIVLRELGHRVAELNRVVMSVVSDDLGAKDADLYLKVFQEPMRADEEVDHV